MKHVRITTRCCDDLPIKNVEIRVGNSTTYKDNPLCNWLPGKQKEGDTILVECVSEDTAGRYVSLLMTGTVSKTAEEEEEDHLTKAESSISETLGIMISFQLERQLANARKFLPFKADM